MGTVITLNPLSGKSIKAAQEAVKRYRDSLIKKCNTFVEKLAEVGIETAVMAMGGDESDQHLGKYIVFKAETEPSETGAKAIMVGSNTGLIHSEWYYNAEGDIKEADVSPILMAEFGAGLLANNERAGEFGMGQGTFPGQTHAKDPRGWWYMPVNKPDGSPNEDHEWYHSTGIRPTMPMVQASAAIVQQIGDVAKEVFGS